MLDFACKTISLEEVVKCSLGLTRSELKMFNFLLEHPVDKYTTDDLAKDLSLNLTTVQRGVKKLTERGALLRSQVNMDGGGYYFVYELIPKPRLKSLILGFINKWVSQVSDALDKL